MCKDSGNPQYRKIFCLFRRATGLRERAEAGFRRAGRASGARGPAAKLCGSRRRRLYRPNVKVAPPAAEVVRPPAARLCGLAAKVPPAARLQVAAVAGTRLHGIEQHVAVPGEILLEVERNAAHGRVVRDPLAAAHDEPQTVVLPQVVLERGQVVPLLEDHEIDVCRTPAAERPQVGHRACGCEDDDLGARVAGQLVDAVHPHLEAGLLFGLLGHDDQVALDGRERLLGVVEEGRDVAVAQYVGCHAADGRTRRNGDAGDARHGGRHVVHAHDDVGDVALAGHADDGVRDVHVVAQQRLQVDVAPGGGRCGGVEDLAGPFLDVGVLDPVVDGVQGVEPVGVPGLLEHDAHGDELLGRAFVGHGNEDVLLRAAGPVVVALLRVAHGDVVGAALRGEGRDGAGGQDHEDRAVEDALVQEPDRLALGRVAEDDVVAHHHGGECRGDVRRAQAEDHRALVLRQTEGLLREEGGDVLGGRDEQDHHGGDLEALPVAEEGAVVDEHAHADQEEGDEDGVADELDAVHQGRRARDEAVEGQTREEGADDGLEACQLRKVGAQEDQRQHEDILRDVVADVLEEPVREQREEHRDDDDAEHDREREPPPEVVVDVARGHAHDDREQQQGQRVGDDRAAHGDRDGLVAGDAELADDGVGDERLRGKEPGQQDRRVEREAQQVVAGEDTQPERHAEGVESEDEAAPAVVLEVGHVHVEPREEHDVEQAGRARKDDAAVAQHEVQSVGANHRAGDDEPQQVGDLELVEDERCREDDDQNEQELQNRVLDRQRQVYGCRQWKHGGRVVVWNMGGSGGRRGGMLFPRGAAATSCSTKLKKSSGKSKSLAARFLPCIGKIWGSACRFYEKNRRICNYLRIKRLFGLLENWVTR
mgnify:CR=1 FL=1